MTKISNQVVYVPDEEISNFDYLIGTDFDDAKKTANFRVGDLGSHFNSINGVRSFDYMFYQHVSASPSPNGGYFYSNGNEQDPENITHFIFSKINLQGKNVLSFIESLVTENPFDIIISQKGIISNSFYFRITSIETFTNYYKINVSKIFYPEGKLLDYTLSHSVYNLKSDGGAVPTKTSDLTNDGEDGVNPFITAEDLPTPPVVPSFADQTETNEGTINNKTISPLTLSGWWDYVKEIAQTFTEKITFSLGILLTPQTAPTHERGRVYFDDVNDCLAYMDSISGTSVQVGQEMIMRARNNTGATILNGSVVYVSGAIGQNSTIALAQANAMPTSEIIGIVTHDIPNNTVGKVCVFGQVNALDTSSFSDGNALFLSSSVAGGLVVTPPISPNFVVAVGVVEHAHPTQGKILVKPQRALANNNSLGTSQSVSATQNAVKSYVDTKLSNDISTYTPATTPLSGTEKALIHDGIDFKEVAVSEFGGGDFIPLSGTTVGNPITGDIEFEETDSFTGLKSNSVASEDYIVFSEEGIPQFRKLLNTGFYVYSGLTGTHFEVGSDSTDFTGIKGVSDYSEKQPLDKLIYAQRQYVDNAISGIYLKKKITPTSAITGTLTESILYTWFIPANTFSSSDWFDIYEFSCASNGTVLANATLRIRFNTLNSLDTSNSKLYAQAVMPSGTTNRISKMERTVDLQGGFIKGYFNLAGSYTDKLSNNYTSNIFDTTVDNYIFFTIQLGNVADSVYGNKLIIKK